MEARRISNVTTEPSVLNNLAYELSDVGADLSTAQQWAQRAVTQTEERTAKTTLSTMDEKALLDSYMLAMEWDTLGWVFFKQGDLATARKYLQAAWKLGQHAVTADHLAQLDETQGKRTAAIHMWRLALASDRNDEHAQEHLRKVGAPFSDPAAKSTSIQPAEELGILRTLKIASLPKQTGSAEFFLLHSKSGIEDVKAIAGTTNLGNGAPAILASKYDFPFPDAGPEKIIRRGILSCSTYTTPSCQFTLLLPASAKLSPLQNSQPSSPGEASTISEPTLVSQVEPEYSASALQARLEGTVSLTIEIDEEGVPHYITVVKSLGMGLDENARNCVAKWRFHPAMRNGKRVSYQAKVEVNFKMAEPKPAAAPGKE